MAYQSTTAHAGTRSFVDQVAAFIADFRAKAARRKVYNETLRELRALNDRELNDLGLNQSMLKRIAYQAAYES